MFRPALRPNRRLPILLAGLAAFVAACGGAAPTTAPTTAGSPAVIAASLDPTLAPPATTAPQTALPATFPPATDAPITAPPPTAAPPSMAPGIGVAIDVGDQQRMTVLAAEQWAGVSGVKPAKGKVFFTVSIRIDAVAVTSFDSADFKLRAGDHSYAWRTGRAPHLYSGTITTPGNYYVGWITYEIPKTALAGDLSLIYKPAFLAGQTFRVPLT